jgi:homoserine dehydrogenase
MDDAIADACARGYADADPSADLEGLDAATKLVILCAVGFGLKVQPRQIDTRPTARVRPEDFRAARLRAGTIRQVAHADYDYEQAVLTAWVAPIFVPGTSVFSRMCGPRNAAIIAGQYAGEVIVAGTGAGPEATAVAAIGDLAAIARDRAAIVPAPVLREPRIIVGLTDSTIAEAV